MMGKPNFSKDFKRDAVAQITERRYPVAEVLKRFGRQPAFALRVEEEAFTATWQRRQGRRDQATEA